MKIFRNILLGLALAAGLALPAMANDKLTFAYLSDPSQEVILWALKNGKVTSELIEVEATALDIPALIQATSARTYDVITTAAMAIPRAMGRGLDLRIIATSLRNNEAGRGGSIWVPKDSTIRSAEDLKGKTVAVLSLGAAGTTLMRISLNKAHGIDVKVPGGDIEFVEVPGPAMPAALSTGKVDAAALSHMQAFQAAKSGDFVPVVEADRDLFEATNLLAVSAIMAGYQDKLDANPEAYHEFLRVLRASRDYALEHSDEVFPAVATEFDIDPSYFSTWFSDFFVYPVELSEQDRKAIAMLWDEASKLGLLESYPTVEEATWKDLQGN